MIHLPRWSTRRSFPLQAVVRVVVPAWGRDVPIAQLQERCLVRWQGASELGVDVPVQQLKLAVQGGKRGTVEAVVGHADSAVAQLARNWEELARNNEFTPRGLIRQSHKIFEEHRLLPRVRHHQQTLHQILAHGSASAMGPQILAADREALCRRKRRAV